MRHLPFSLLQCSLPLIKRSPSPARPCLRRESSAQLALPFSRGSSFVLFSIVFCASCSFCWLLMRSVALSFVVVQGVVVYAVALRILLRNCLCSIVAVISLLFPLFVILDSSPHFPNCFTRVRSSPLASGVCTCEEVCRYIASVAIDILKLSLFFPVSAEGLTVKGDEVPSHQHSPVMGNTSTSGCTRQFERLDLSDGSCTRSGSSKVSGYGTALASDADHETESSIYFSAVEERIEQSKAHWSLLSESRSIEEERDGEVAEESNVKVFEDLERHSTWGGFFWKQDEFSEFEVGEKFAEGAQAELFHVQVRWNDPTWNEWNRKNGIEYVVKVFKKGTFLQDLQLQVPRGYLDFRSEFIQAWSIEQVEVPRFRSSVISGVLLKDGRFAFLMEKEHFDLRYMIERNMKSRSGGGKGPFSKEEAEFIMYRVALGVDWLHGHNIIHRDLKASNVLVWEIVSGHYPKFLCCVADYESSVGVIGTGFFRAPEVLQACKDRKLRERPEVFSRAADIYSYGMVCYEVLTGKLPFEGHLSYDYDHVLNGQCPMLPDYVEGWTCELLKKCWQLDPSSRPKIGEIIDLFLIHSIEAKKYEETLKSYYGHNYSRDWSNIEIPNF